MLVALSTSALDKIDLVISKEEMEDIYSDEKVGDDYAVYLSGNKEIPGSRPAAHCYCGHQFGHFSGQLGGILSCFYKFYTR